MQHLISMSMGLILLFQFEAGINTVMDSSCVPSWRILSGDSAVPISANSGHLPTYLTLDT